jgi:hypothetical protein
VPPFSEYSPERALLASAVLLAPQRMGDVIRVFAVPDEHAVIRVIEHRDHYEMILRKEDGRVRHHVVEAAYGAGTD